jgi:hypothetical protein
LAAFRKRAWEDAIGKFRQSMEILGMDEPSRFYLKICEQHKANPPGETWDGVVDMDMK